MISEVSVDYIFFPSSHKISDVSLHSCPKETAVIRFLLLIFNWEQSIIAIHETHILKTVFLHMADAIYSALGG